MHALVVSGVFDTVMFLLLVALQTAGLFGGKIYDTFFNYVSLWVLPAGKHTAIHMLFTRKKADSNKRAKTFKCQASDAFGVYPIMIFSISQ